MKEKELRSLLVKIVQSELISLINKAIGSRSEPDFGPLIKTAFETCLREGHTRI